MSAESAAQPSVTFRLPVVGEILGGTPIWEEWHGDFSQALIAAEKAVSDATDPSARADAVVARALVALLQGDLYESRKLLQDQWALISADPLRATLAFVYDHFAQMNERRLAPGTGLFSMELEQGWNAIELMGEQERKFAALMEKVQDDSVAMHARVIYNVAAMAPVYRQMLDSHYSTVPQDKLDEFVGMMGQSALQVQQMAAGRGASPRVVAYLDTVVASYAAKAGLVDVARQMFARAHQFYGQGGDVVGMARCIVAIGDTFCAPASSPEIWNLSVQESASESSALTWKDQGRELRLDDIDEVKAREIYTEAMEMFRHVGCQRGIAALMLRFSWLSVLRNDYRAACEQLEAASETARSSGDVLMHALARVALQVARVGENVWAEEHRTFEEIGDWGRSCGSVAWAAALGRFTARAAARFSVYGEYERARASYRMARALYGQLGAPVNEAQVLVDLGNLHAMVGDRPAALVQYNEALRMQARATEKYPALSSNVEMWAGRVNVQLYSMYEAEADPEGIQRVIKALEKRVQPHDPTNLSHLPSRSWDQIVEQSRSEGDLKNGETFDLWMSTVANQELAMTLEMARVTACCYRALKARDSENETEADTLFGRAMEYAAAAKLASSNFLRAVVLGHKRDYAGAAAAYELHTAGTDAARQLVDLMQQSPEGALESRRHQENVEEQSAIFMLRIRQYERAQRHFDRLQELAGPEWWKRNSAPWASQSDLGEVCEGLGQLAQALKWYETGIADLEAHSRRVSAEEWKIALAGRGSSRFLYFYAARCALKLMNAAQTVAERREYADRLFRLLEAGRARVLLDVMGTEEADSAKAATVRQLRGRISMWNSVLAGLLENGAVPARIDSYRTRLASDTEALLAFEKELVAEVNRTPTLSLDQVSRMLASDTCLVEYSYAGNEAIAVVVTPDGMADAKLLDHRAAVIDAKAAALQDACKRGLEWEPLAADLASILIDPVGKTLTSHARLVIAAHGATHHIPFGVLPLDGQLLAESHEISYVPSASILEHLRVRKSATQSFLGIGNPANMSYQPAPGKAQIGLAPLVGAETEVISASRLFENSLILIGKDATERAATEAMPRYRLIHFATHGRLDPNTPHLSGLMLADGAVLNVYEITGMLLDADLVVLSACDTGSGRVTGGDDMIGLSHAFLGAGARSLIVSLWPVDDRSTAFTMQGLYEELRRGSTPSAALNAAQKALRSMKTEDVSSLYGGDVPVSHPLYWAPFVVIGAA